MANNTIVISRIQHRRGLKENLPQPLLPGEIALTVDSGELWIGNSLDQPPFGIKTFGSGASDISAAESIADTQIASIKFDQELEENDFDSFLAYITDPGALSGENAPPIVLTEDDVHWDGLSNIFIAADITSDPANTINNILEASSLWLSAGAHGYNPEESGALGAINQPYVQSTAASVDFVDGNPDMITRTGGDFTADGFYSGQTVFVSNANTPANNTSLTNYYTIDSVSPLTITLVAGDSLTADAGDSSAIIRGRSDPLTSSAFNNDGAFQFGSTIHTPNSQQGSNAAILINEINGAGIVTTFGNLQIPTSGIGVGSPTYRDITVDDTDTGYVWSPTGTASADSTVDELTLVSGENINIDIDTTQDAVRVSSTAESDPDKLYTGFNTGTTEFTLSGNTASFTDVTGFAFNLDTESDVIFVQYSGNIDGANVSSNNYTVMGQMEVIANNLTDSGLATLNDEQNEVRDSGLSGDINFQAVYSSGSPNRAQIQYTNTFTEDVILRILTRRFASF